MEIEMCEEFYYRVNGKNFNLFKEFNTDKNNVLRNNQNINIYSGEWLKIKVNDFITHIVKPLETVDIIANNYEIDRNKILIDNNLESEKLFIGQIIKIYK